MMNETLKRALHHARDQGQCKENLSSAGHGNGLHLKLGVTDDKFHLYIMEDLSGTDLEHSGEATAHFNTQALW